MFTYLPALLCLMSVACFASENAAVSIAGKRVAAAQKKVQTEPKSFQSYNDLATALCRQARDSDDIQLYEKADAAILTSFKLSPANYEAQKLQIAVLTGKHEFSRALQLAAAINKKVPDDLTVWALLVDIHAGLGDYPEAERCAQWVLDLRPGGKLGFLKAAELREAFGDLEGANEFYQEANRRTSGGDSDERAWLLTQNARMELTLGHPKEAALLIDQAQTLDSASQLALAALAQLKLAEGNPEEAVALLQRRAETLPSAANLYELANALEKAGRKEQAAVVYSQFETKGRAEMERPHNVNPQLALFYSDKKSDPALALTAAEREIAVRHDVQTLDAYAWALYRNGKFDEARKQMDRLIAVNARDSGYLCHARKIAESVNDAEGIQRFSCAAQGGLR